MRHRTEAIMPSSGKAGCGESRLSGLEGGSRKPGSREEHRAASRRFGPFSQTSRKTPKAPSFYPYGTALSLLAVPPTVAAAKPDREAMELSGPVKKAVIEERTISHQLGRGSEGPRTLQETYTYNAQGNFLEVTSTGRQSKSLYTYDAKGRRAKAAFYKQDGSLSSRGVYSYDAQGTVTMLTYTADGAVQGQAASTSDPKGSEIQKVLYNPDGSRDSLDVYTFDEKGNKTEVAAYHADGSLLAKKVSSYDSEGNRTGETLYAGVRRDFIAQRVYTYECDAHGNWIKRHVAKQAPRSGPLQLEPSEVTYRTITYYGESAE
jgi:YD repeat-containing protein